LKQVLKLLKKNSNEKISKKREMALCAGICAKQRPKLQVICDQLPLIIPFYHTFKQTLMRSTYAVQCIFVIT
jgi:uncharacterized protein YaaW (UPF0174 family)